MKFVINHDTPASRLDYGHHVPEKLRGKIISTPEADKLISARAVGGPCVMGRKNKK